MNIAILMQTRIILNSFENYFSDACCRLRRSAAAALSAVLVAALAGCAGPGGPAPVSPEVAPALSKRAPRIGLALGGGAAKGFAHVGVIAVLEEAGLRPDYVVGTSAGSLVAALYASGKSSAELHKTAMSMEEAAITDWMLRVRGWALD